MPRARFIGDPRRNFDGPAEVSSCNHHFIKGEWTEVSAAAAARLSVNNHFEIDADGDGEPGPTVEELRAALDAKGITYHHKAGVKKLQELLSDAG